MKWFLKKCLFYNVFPKFVQFKVSSITFTKTKLYQECQTNILKHELKQLDDKVQKLQEEQAFHKEKIRIIVSHIDYKPKCSSRAITRFSVGNWIRVNRG